MSLKPSRNQGRLLFWKTEWVEPLAPVEGFAGRLHSVLWQRRNQEKDSDDKEPECRADRSCIPVRTCERTGKEYPRRPGNKRPRSERDAQPGQHPLTPGPVR